MYTITWLLLYSNMLKQYSADYEVEFKYSFVRVVEKSI